MGSEKKRGREGRPSIYDELIFPIIDKLMRDQPDSTQKDLIEQTQALCAEMGEGIPCYGTVKDKLNQRGFKPPRFRNPKTSRLEKTIPKKAPERDISSEADPGDRGDPGWEWRQRI